LKRLILKLIDAGGDTFCGRNFHKSCIQIFALKFWKKNCVSYVMKNGDFLTSDLFCFAADGSVFSP
jgi:hypothetical protein